MGVGSAASRQGAVQAPDNKPHTVRAAGSNTTPRSARRTLRLMAAAAGLAAALVGCERSAAPTSQAAAPPQPQRSPRATIEQLMTSRESGSYQAMGELILPGRTHEITNTLMAVDEFLHANRALCNYVRDKITLGLAQAIDQAHWGDHLGVFSRFVELVDEQTDGDAASVSFTVDGDLPLRHARLQLVSGAWRYDPGPGYDPQLPAAFRRMARGLRLVLDDLKSGYLSADAIRADPERLLEEVRVRLLPGVNMLPPIPAAEQDED